MRILISHIKALGKSEEFIKLLKRCVNVEADKILQRVLVRSIDDYSPRQLYLMQNHVNEYWMNMPTEKLDHKKIADELGMALPTGMVERLAPKLAELEKDIEDEEKYDSIYKPCMITKTWAHEDMVNDIKQDLANAKELLKLRQEEGIQESLLDTIRQHIRFLTEKLEKAEQKL